MLETEDLTKVFKKHVAVDKVNLYLDRGESIGLLGPNGAGKSTTISMISSLVKPSSGDIRIHGQSIIKHPDHIRKVLGVVPQDIALYPELTATENLAFFGQIYGLKGNKLKDSIQHVLRQVGLEERQKDQVKTYSGGMQRRINMAIAMLHEPDILIMDEPTVGIDPQSRHHILETVRELNEEKGMTVLYTSHYMEEVERLCDRVYIMDHGQMIASGTKDELKQILSAEEAILIDLAQPTDAEQLLSELQSIKGVLKTTQTETGLKLIVPRGQRLLSRVFQAAELHNAQIINVTVQTPTLEDVFLHLTGRTLRD
ncbi:ABC transporter ATP-binding protein [Salipaludibacillus agaradhaerens]|jgi:ABC-2 type transport system ATP-binding protein|uniref:ABC transporter ATP-binding protein n=1 Tax=Salipaludibacillus agaradhaerens TaxID=76935 RepID=UPI000998C0C5|nr:ABC transporter ATP-binding protein [Salipaludibacillus agaradhaerens]